jgi:FMN phosphatase YigB (HAD superfamily)
MTKPILFCDFDGTICHDRYWRSLPSEQYEKVQSLLFRDDKTYVSDWMRGKYTAEQVNEKVAHELGLPYEQVWQLFVNDCSTMRVSQETLEKLSALRSRYTVVLMTGNMDSFSRFTVPALGLENYFDCISNSYHEGKHKTDDKGQIFTEYADKFGVPLKECVVIDDSQNVCATFEALGGMAYAVTPEKTITHYLAQI